MSKRPDVFSDSKAFRQQVRLLAVQAAGLTAEELATALAYEVEPVSGIPAAEAETAFRDVPDPDTTVRVFDVAVRRKSAKRGKDAAWVRLLRFLLVLGPLACLIAAADGAYLLWRHRDVTARVTVQERLDAELQGIRRRAQNLRDEATKLRTARTARAAAQETVASLRTRAHDVLAAVGEACGAKAVLVSAEVGLRHAEIRAMAVTPQAASDVTAALAERAGRLGWRLAPGSIEANGTRSSATFTCELDHD